MAGWKEIITRNQLKAISIQVMSNCTISIMYPRSWNTGTTTLLMLSTQNESISPSTSLPNLVLNRSTLGEFEVDTLARQTLVDF